MFFGKAIRVLAAVLVFTSSISTFAYGEHGANSSNTVPSPGAPDPSALLVTAMHMPDQVVSLPGGAKGTLRTDVISATGPKDQLATMLEMEQKAIEAARSQDGVAESLIDELAPEAQAIAEKINLKSEDGEIHKIRIPSNWKEYFKFYGQDLKALHKGGYQIDPDNYTATVVRASLNFGVPFVMAVLVKGLPIWMPLGYTLAFGDQSGLISSRPELFPWNRPFPKSPEELLSKDKKSEVRIWSTKLVTYVGVELPFLAFPQWIMKATNQVAIYLGVHAKIDVMSFSGLLKTALMGAGSQGLWEIGNAKLMEDRLEAAEQYKDTHPKEYIAAVRKIRKSFYKINFAASVTEVSLAALMLASQSHQFIPWVLFGVYAGGGLTFMSYAFESKWTKWLADFFGVNLDKVKWGLAVPDSVAAENILEKEPPLIEKKVGKTKETVLARCARGLSAARGRLL